MLKSFEPFYPDVLGAITGGARINMDKIQVALGIFPRRTVINQPVEVIIILQNMVNQPMQIKVGIQLPNEDKQGEPMVIDLPKKTLSLGLRPGEVGVLRVPVVPLPPTKPGNGVPVRIAVRYRTPAEGQAVRPPGGGAPPSVLSVSSFKLQALKDVQFAAHTWNQSTDIITSYFDIAPKRIPPSTQPLDAQYETLWTHEEMAEERELVLSKVADARRVAAKLTRSLYAPVLKAVEDRFADRGMPLHPAEAQAIAKMVTYALDEGYELEPGFKQEDARWFHTLCQVLAHDETLEDMKRDELVLRYLFDSALYDAVILGFAVVQPKVKEDLGDAAERAGFANRILSWFAGQGQPDLSYAYLPLVLGGVVVNQVISSRDDNPWDMILDLREAVRGRARLVTGEAAAIFGLMRELLDEAEDSLKRARIPR